MSQVSAIVPTVGRPELRRAVISVLEQTVEVTPIVVLDRPELYSDVTTLLEGLEYEILITEGSVGGSEARNIGVRRANTEVVAFLDDDDEWLPNKTRRQLQELNGVSNRVVSCRSLLVGKAERELPRRLFSNNGDIGSYLVTRDAIRLTNNFMQTSGIMLHRDLCKSTQWNSLLPRHQDWGFFIDLQRAGAEFVSTPEALVRVYQGSSNSVSRSNAWEASLEWLAMYGDGFTQRARGDFLAAIASRSAFRSRQWAAAWRLVVEAARSRAHLAALTVGLSGVIGK